jgi:hypothetical protein
VISTWVSDFFCVLEEAKDLLAVPSLTECMNERAAAYNATGQTSQRLHATLHQQNQPVQTGQ